ncbi:hydrophobic surface binding protein A-domain-containing protein [Flagelloscypha sp. PMI_526]|nr:hydrophobic surface binding protein A-domain-containing protein [Flagelloscypha sp. PMI_526]
MHLQFLFGLILAASTVFATVLPRVGDPLKADIAAIQTAANKLDVDINAFPNTGGTVVGALGLHADFVNLINAINQGITDASAIQPVDPGSAQELYDDMLALKPVFLDILSVAIAKKPVFDSLPLSISTLLLADIKNLKNVLSQFFGIIIPLLPPPYDEETQILENDIIDAFNTAIAAWGG